MGLQLRVIDGIRTRVVQVEERDAQRPVRIGSAADCDIRVGAGAPVQCEVFVHQGRWVVRNVLPDRPIRVGGKLVSKGAYLDAEDRISLGDGEGAAVIEVGPLAVTAGGVPARPTAPDAIAELTSPGEGGETWFQEDPDEMVPLGGGGGAVASRRRAMKRESGGSAGWTIVFAAVVVAGAGAAWWKFRPREELPKSVVAVKPEAAPLRTTAPATGPSRQQKNIFDAGWKPGANETTPVKHPATLDPRKREENWVALEKAVNGPSPARAVYAIQEYRDKHPGQFESELDEFLDDALDRIWWQRIKELCDRRDELKREIQLTSDAIAEETEEEHRKKLEEQRTAKEGLLRWELEALIKQMGYHATETPNLADEEMLAHLRKERDPALYASWKGRVVKGVMASRGYLPWERAK